ncbi:MAG: hypothetical protein AB1426_08295 [Bacillota bacterium]
MEVREHPDPTGQALSRRSFAAVSYETKKRALTSTRLVPSNLVGAASLG